MVISRKRLRDLDRRQPDAGRVVHGLEHVVGELADLRRHLSTGLETSRNCLSGRMMISLRAIAGDLSRRLVGVNASGSPLRRP